MPQSALFHSNGPLRTYPIVHDISVKYCLTKITYCSVQLTARLSSTVVQVAFLILQKWSE
jgi:hypothetical protein